MKVKKITGFLDGRFPLELQENYDNAGNQVVFFDNEITGVLVSLDCGFGIIQEAMDRGCNLIVTHHPLLFSPVKRLQSGDPRSEMIYEMVRRGISLYSAHTNLDKVYYDKLAGLLELNDTVLCVETGSAPKQDHGAFGFGVMGALRVPVRLTEMMKLLKAKLDLEYMIFSGDGNRMISTVAVVNGAAGRLIEKIIIQHSPQCIVTGDVGHHHSRLALDYGVAVVDAGHYGTEKLFLNFLKQEIQDYLTKSRFDNRIIVVVSETEQSPFRLYT